MTGIYQIQSIRKPERIYIGSSLHILKRKAEHFRKLRNNQHHSNKLQRHYKKYGKSDLKFSILLCCNKEDLIKTEQYFMDCYKPYFNNWIIADRPIGHKWTKEQKLKISAQRKGRPGVSHSEESKNKMSLARIGNKNCVGRILSEETKMKIRKSLIGRKLSEERIQKIKNRQISEETRRRMSEMRKGEGNGMYGRNHSQETKLKISQKKRNKTSGENNPFYGKKHTLETREKMKKAWKIRKLKFTTGYVDKN